MDSPLSPAARVAARVVFAGLPPAWLSTFDSSSSLDDDDDDDEALDGYDEDPFDDDPRRARRQYPISLMVGLSAISRSIMGITVYSECIKKRQPTTMGYGGNPYGGWRETDGASPPPSK